MSRTNCKCFCFFVIFCRSSFSFDKLKNLARHTINKFLLLKRRHFSHASKIAFFSSEIAEDCKPPP